MTQPHSATPLDSNPEQSFAQVIRPASQNSVEFGRNAKGEPSWSVKLYFTTGDEFLTVERLNATDHALVATFAPKWAGHSAALEGASEA